MMGIRYPTIVSLGELGAALIFLYYMRAKDSTTITFFTSACTAVPLPFMHMPRA